MSTTKILILAGLIVAFALVGQADIDEAERQQTEYCAQVALWKATNGQDGWPAYRGEKWCK